MGSDPFKSFLSRAFDVSQCWMSNFFLYLFMGSLGSGCWWLINFCFGFFDCCFLGYSRNVEVMKWRIFSLSTFLFSLL